MSWTGQRLARVVLPAYLGGIYATLYSVRFITNFLRDRGLLRLAVVVAFLAVAAVVLAVLLRDQAARTWRVGVAVGLIGGAYFLVTFPMASPEEKLHFIEYGGVALLAYAAAPERLQGLRRFVAAALFVVAAGWLDEGIQALLPNRYYDLRDVGFNAAAGVMALGALAAYRAARRIPMVAVPARDQSME